MAKLDKSMRLETFQSDFQEAYNAKVQVQEQIDTNRQLFEGEPVRMAFGSDKNSFVIKDIRRAVEGVVPQILEAFLSTPNAILAEATRYGSDRAAQIATAILNNEFENLGKDEFLEELARTMIVDGTVWLRAGWRDDMATAYVCENDAIFPDPSAKRVQDMKFLVYRRKVSKMDIRANEAWFGKGAYEKVKGIDTSGNTQFQSGTLNSYREEHGYNDSFQFSQGDERALVEVYEYYGYDMNGEPVIAIWCEDELLRDEPSPFGSNPIPFVSKTYMKSPHSIWGDGLPQLIMDNQIIRSKLYSGLLDNITLANNGQKFIKKGAMDYVNWKRMSNGERYIQVNALPRESMEDGNFNPIPPSTFQLIENLQLDEEQLTGITRFTQGNDSRALNSTARGIAMLSNMAQQRTLHTIRAISSLVRDLMYIWHDLNRELLPYSGSVNINGRYETFLREQLGEKMKISINVGVAGIAEAKTQNIMMLIDLAQRVPGIIPQDAIKEMIAQLADTNYLPSVGSMIRDVNNEAQNQQAQAQMAQAQQVEMSKVMSEVEKNRALAVKYEADADRAQTESFKTAMEASTGTL